MSEPTPEYMIDPIIYAMSDAVIDWSEEEFALLMVSGEDARHYQCSPKHMKRLSMLLQLHVEAYEAAHGKLETELVAEEPETDEDQPIGFRSSKGA